MTEQLNVQQMAEKLLAADNILILCHKNPDGDTVGCGSALYYALLALEKHAAVLCADPIPGRYAFTNPRLFKGEFEPQIVVAVDVASVQLFGEGNGVPQYTRHVDLCIDHHAGNSGYAEFTLLDGSAAAAAELLYEVICAMHVEITPHIADCLYTGLSTDTGCFRFSNTPAHSFSVAALCTRAGARIYELNQELFEPNTLERLKMQAWIVEHLELLRGGEMAICAIPRAVEEEIGVNEDDMDNISNFPRTVAGVRMAATLRETGDGETKLSVRAVPGCDATAVTVRFGGGGHKGAAGATVDGTLDEAKAAILAAYTEVMG